MACGNVTLRIAMQRKVGALATRQPASCSKQESKHSESGLSVTPPVAHRGAIAVNILHEEGLATFSVEPTCHRKLHFYLPVRANTSSVVPHVASQAFHAAMPVSDITMDGNTLHKGMAALPELTAGMSHTAA